MGNLPSNKKLFTSTKQNDNTVLISTIDDDVILSYYMSHIQTEKAFTTIVKAVEKLVRSSRSYSSFVGRLKSDLNLTNCTFLENVDDTLATIEMHHYPLTLYEITEIIIIKNLIEKNFFSTFTLANDVMNVHKLFQVGIVPLSKTIHELAHSGKVFIPFDVIIGDWKKFLELYDVAITDSHKLKLEKLTKKNQEFMEDATNANTILELKKIDNRQYTYLLSNNNIPILENDP